MESKGVAATHAATKARAREARRLLREAEGALRFGCPFCGASSEEPCVNQQDMSDMDFPHGERIRFAAVHDRSLR